MWVHDFTPALATAGGDDDRCVVVGVPNEATPATLKLCLTAAVAFVHPATRTACLRRVGRVDFDERHPGLFGLVGQTRAELGERPRMHRGPLGLTKPYPRPDPRQLFDGDPAPGALRLGHDAFRYLMVEVGGEAGLLTAALLQQPPRRLHAARAPGVRHHIPPTCVHRPDAHLLRAPHAATLRRHRRRPCRVQRRDRPCAPACALPTQPGTIRSGQPAHRRLVSPATPAVPGGHSKISVGQALLVALLLRRLLRGRTRDHHQAIHRTAEPPRPMRPAGRNNGIGFLPV